jgi:hypothetical protein
MAYKGNRVARPVHPMTRITSSTTSETATVKPQIHVTPALRKLANEKRAYLASGEESNKNSVYTPQNHGSKTPSHGSPSRTEMTPATDEPKSTDIGYTAPRHKCSEVTMSLEDREDCCWAKYRVQCEVRWAQIQEHTHIKAMTFLSHDMNDHNPTQEDVTPVYLAMLYKAAKAYCQKKDKREQSS